MGCNGMSLRDYFAGQAIQAILRINGACYGGDLEALNWTREQCRMAYFVADALVEARK
jgi:hypothetical protein